MTLNVASISGTLSNVALVIPGKNQGYQPFNPAWKDTPPALLFHYEDENRVELQSDITDHFVENNTAIQDQISLKPERVTVRGFIGELNDIPPKSVLSVFKTVAKLPIITDLSPKTSISAQLAYNQAFQAYQTAASLKNSAVSAWSSINGNNGVNAIGSNGLGTSFDPTTGRVSNNQTKQQVMFQQFYGYWSTRTLFTVQTPWAIFQNMAIETVRGLQDRETRMISDFTVTFKMIRFAEISSDGAKAFSGRAQYQAAPLVDQGTVNPVASPLDLNSAISDSAWG